MPQQFFFRWGFLQVAIVIIDVLIISMYRRILISDIESMVWKRTLTA